MRKNNRSASDAKSVSALNGDTVLRAVLNAINKVRLQEYLKIESKLQDQKYFAKISEN